MVAHQLLRRHDGRATLNITDEYDVQDLLHALLRLFFDDVREEEYTPSYAGRSARMDFLLKRERTVIECKMTRDSLGEREVGDQFIADIAHYREHPDCSALVCLVYDPSGKIRNPQGLKSDLERSPGEMSIEVHIVQ